MERIKVRKDLEEVMVMLNWSNKLEQVLKKGWHYGGSKHMYKEGDVVRVYDKEQKHWKKLWQITE